MKSLEIVNKHIEDMKRQLALIEEDRKNDIEWYHLDPLYREIEYMNIIKADLEVLEIIKKHLEVYIWQNIFSEEHELEVDIILKHIDNEEERYKVKQWLEENENDR